MIRETVIGGIDHDPDFEWRGQSVTRIENLSDIVFALALGMLVSSSAPPVSFQDLFGFMLNIVPVSAAFAILLTVWNAHFVYFRRYGLADGHTIFLNATLLLLVLFTAYPLRFCFDSLFGFILLQMGYPDRIATMESSQFNAAHTIILYSIGISILYFILAQMYTHALRRKKLLSLSTHEISLTKRSIFSMYAQIIAGIIVIFGAIYTSLGPFAGFFFMLNWPFAFVGNKIFKGDKHTAKNIRTTPE